MAQSCHNIKERTLMAKLSDTQLVLLSNAAKRDDGALVVPPKLKGPVADEAIAPLLSTKLCKAVPKSGQLPLWKRGANDEPLSLVITPRGLTVIGVEPEGKPTEADSTVTQTKRQANKSSGAKPQKAKSGKAATSRQKPTQRANSKIAKVVEMLRTPTGSTIRALMKATGWQAHSVRGAISGAIKKRLGLKVTSELHGDERFYRAGA
jgi:hypothetical protein